MVDSDREKVVKIRMSIRIEKNSKFVRGMKKTKEQIEQYLKAYYNMQIDTAGDYLFHMRYVTVNDLENTIYDILGELNSTADDNNCFIESDVFCDELGLYW